MGNLEREVEGEPAVAGVVLQEVGGPGNALQNGVAVDVQPLRRPGCVVRLFKEDPQRLAQQGRMRVIRSQGPERRGDEPCCPALVTGRESGDLQLGVGHQPLTLRMPGEDAVDRQRSLVRTPEPLNAGDRGTDSRPDGRRYLKQGSSQIRLPSTPTAWRSQPPS
jgi:hypothetical protein